MDKSDLKRYRHIFQGLPRKHTKVLIRALYLWLDSNKDHTEPSYNIALAENMIRDLEFQIKTPKLCDVLFEQINPFNISIRTLSSYKENPVTAFKRYKRELGIKGEWFVSSRSRPFDGIFLQASFKRKKPKTERIVIPPPSTPTEFLKAMKSLTKGERDHILSKLTNKVTVHGREEETKEKETEASS